MHCVLHPGPGPWGVGLDQVDFMPLSHPSVSVYAPCCALNIPAFSADGTHGSSSSPSANAVSFMKLPVISSSIHSLNKYFLSVSVPGTVLGAWQDLCPRGAYIQVLGAEYNNNKIISNLHGLLEGTRWQGQEKIVGKAGQECWGESGSNFN